MPYGRRRFRRRVRRVRGRPSSARRRYRTFRKTYRKFRKTVTGIGSRKSLKVRKDFTYVINGADPSSSYNIIYAGAAQTANLTGWGIWTGNSPSSLASIDTSGSTGLSQWFNFYNRYVVHGSKVRIELFATAPNQSKSLGWAVTLVPTVGFNLASGPNGASHFDSLNIDPGELPYARKVLIPNDGAPNNATTRKLTSYISVKKMLNIKDVNDVVNVPGSNLTEVPFVPAIFSATTSGAVTQLLSGANIGGIYWNLVLQEVGQKLDNPPTGPFHGSMVVRIIQTSYIQFSDRKPLTT